MKIRTVCRGAFVLLMCGFFTVAIYPAGVIPLVDPGTDVGIHEQARFFGVGDLPGGPTISVVRDATKSDGVIYAVGASGANGANDPILCDSPNNPVGCVTQVNPDTAVLWTWDGTTATLTPLPDLQSPSTPPGNALFASAITRDAAYIASQARSSAEAVAVRVARIGLFNLDLSATSFPPLMPPASAAQAISDDGSILYGVAGDSTRAIRFDVNAASSSVIPLLLGSHTGNEPAGRGISSDGSVMVGTSFVAPFTGTNGRAFRYVHASPVGTVSAIPLLSGGTWNKSIAVSPDGNQVLVAGNSTFLPNGEVYLYDVMAGTSTALGSPNTPWTPADLGGMTADGSVVAVTFVDGTNAGHAYIRNAHGWFHLTTIIGAQGIDLGADGWVTADGGVAMQVTGISPDGTLVFGSGERNGNLEGFVAEFPAGYLASFDVPAVPQTDTAIVGVWTGSGDSGQEPDALVLLADGTYFHLDARHGSQPAAEFTSGFERGRYHWDASTGAITWATLQDTNGSVGLSGGNGVLGMVVTISGDTLQFGSDETATRVTSGPGSIVGGWVLGDPRLDDGSAVLVLLGDGTFLFAVDGISSVSPFCHDGIEFGTYAWGADGAFTATSSTDTNGECGLTPSAGVGRTLTLQLSPDGLHLGEPGGPIQFTRIVDPLAVVPEITSPLTADGTAGSLFEYTITATHAASFGATDLPTWLSPPTATGLISGTPPAPGTFNVTISATNSFHSTDTESLTITVRLATDPAPLTVIDFEDQPDNLTAESFPTFYHGVTWTGWHHYAPYPGYYAPHGVNAIYTSIGGSPGFSFPERVFVGAWFSRYSGAQGQGRVYFELYDRGTLVWTSADLADVPPQITFLPSGYAGLVDEVRVQSTVAGYWVMDDVTFAMSGAPPALPSIIVTSPTEPIYELGSTVVLDYQCIAAIVCVAQNATGAPVLNGARLDTSTSGRKSITITATDAQGNKAEDEAIYYVSVGTAVEPFAGVTAWLPGDGTPQEVVSRTSATWIGTPQYDAGKVSHGFDVADGTAVSLSVTQPGPFTLQAWVRTPDRLQPEFTGVLASGDAGQTATTFQFELDGLGNYRLNMGASDLSWLIGPATDAFAHLAATYDGTTVSAYLNGQIVQSDAWLGIEPPGFTALTIGRDRDGLFPFTGVVDEVQVFNRALTGDEVAQSFLAGASGFVKNHRPLPDVSVTPASPVEATGPTGAPVLFDGTGSSDPDGDTLTYRWAEGETTLGTDATLLVVLSLGEHVVTLTVDDGRGMTDSTTEPVTVQDTAGPVLSVPDAVVKEADGPAGAVVTFAASAIDLVDGPVDVTCTPASGSLFPLGTTRVTCSAVDTRDNHSHEKSFPVTVEDTTSPTAQVLTPSVDALLTAATTDVTVQATDVVGVARVVVNGVGATRTAGTPQAGTWRATVPITLPVAPGGALTFNVVAADAAGKEGPASRLVDNDGIPSLAPTVLDRSRTGGVDQSDRFSSEFTNVVTAGTLVRNGWTTKVSNGATANAVRVQLAGTGTGTGAGTGTVPTGPALVQACTGTAKEIRLDVLGETADLICNPVTGSITVKAVSALPRIEVVKQTSATTWMSAQIPTGYTFTTGSPATAGADNRGRLTVQVFQRDETGAPIVIGAFELAPGASVNVTTTPGRTARREDVHFHVLRGRVPLSVGGRTRTLAANERTSVETERERKR